MAEEHTMEVRWSGDVPLGNAMADAARQRGLPAEMETVDGHAVLAINVVDSDLQSLRDRVDELLVVLSALEEAHQG
mgnify:FL=1|tara:strand:- start:1608 stop:1835 length:228 start_codon:yes stop_codon:yes gene_type:complete